MILRKALILLMCGVSGVAVTLRRADASECCPADLSGDTVVDAVDLALVLGSWGTCPDPGDCPADLTADGTVDPSDLALLLGDWGSCLFDYGPPPEDLEAQQIGLEMLGASGPLVVPPDVYARIDRDLDLIRDAEASLLGQTHSAAWSPSSMLVQLDEQAPQDEFLCANEYYHVISVNHLFLNWYVMTLAGKLNVPALAQIYTTLPNVQFAEPDGLIGGQNFWLPTDVGDGTWRWDIDDGWLDCFDGCDCHRVWVFQTDEAGHLTLIGFQQFGQPWCDFPE